MNNNVSNNEKIVCFTYFKSHKFSLHMPLHGPKYCEFNKSCTVQFYLSCFKYLTHEFTFVTIIGDNYAQLYPRLEYKLQTKVNLASMEKLLP